MPKTYCTKSMKESWSTVASTVLSPGIAAVASIRIHLGKKSRQGVIQAELDIFSVLETDEVPHQYVGGFLQGKPLAEGAFQLHSPCLGVPEVRAVLIRCWQFNWAPGTLVRQRFSETSVRYSIRAYRNWSGAPSCHPPTSRGLPAPVFWTQSPTSGSSGSCPRGMSLGAFHRQVTECHAITTVRSWGSVCVAAASLKVTIFLWNMYPPQN